MNAQSKAMIDRLAKAATWELGGVEWPSGVQKRVHCCRVVAETHDVKSFVFKTEDGAPIRFEPGQFVTINVEIDGRQVSRCYTISSPPTRPFTFSITVKRVPGGTVSNWLHDNLQAGGELSAFGPAGDFTPTAAPATRLLYLSAGSGVTPLMSMTRSSIDLGQDVDIVFLHSARTPADIVFRQELSQLSRLGSRLRVISLCEALGEERDWPGHLGRLSLDLLRQLAPDFLEREVFTCGPEGYMRATRELLLAGGYNAGRYHQESFNLDLPAGSGTADTAVSAAPAAEATQAQAAAQSFTVRLAKSQKSFSIDATQSVLSAVKKAGCAIASSCQQGVCGSCKTMLVEGSVDMKHQGGIRQREIDKGMRLLCCSYATSDLVLDL